MWQKLFVKWVVPLIIFAFYSCSDEMNQENIANLELNKDSVLTRGDPWDEVYESPLEWADRMEGTYEYMATMMYMYVGSDSEYKTTDKYWGCVRLDWGTHDELSSGDLAANYLLQVMWTWDDFVVGNNRWRYIRMPGNNYGLVGIIANGTHEDIPAYAFPYSDWPHYIGIRMRLIKKEFIKSVPLLGVERDDKYDRNLFSPWWVVGNGIYKNHWGYDESNPEYVPDSGEVGKSELRVIVVLPKDNDLYNYGYEVYTDSGLCGKGQNNDGRNGADSNFAYKGIVVKSDSGRGTVIVYAMRYNMMSGEKEFCTTSMDYGAGEKDVVIYVSEGSFGYD